MGVQINGDTGNISATKADYSGNVTIGGTLTYEDVTNVDSIGIVTAREGIEIGARPGVAASISVDGNMIVSGISTFGGALSGTTGTFSSEITGTRTNVLASSTPHIRINNDTGDGSGTRVMLGKATADNNFINGAASGDTVLSVPGKFIHGVGTSAKVTVETAGNVNVASNLKVAGVCTATSFSGSGANLTGIVAIPSGGIILWSGAANAIPSGFVLCDGNNSTPNLSGKFVVGYDASNGDYDVGDTGGSESVTLTTSQIPSHNHTINYGNTPAGGSRSAALYTSDNQGTQSINSTGGGGSHENRPPYYALCYIMKT